MQGERESRIEEDIALGSKYFILWHFFIFRFHGYLINLANGNYTLRHIQRKL